MAAAQIAGGWAGARWASRVQPVWIRRVVLAVVALLVAKLSADIVKSLG